MTIQDIKYLTSIDANEYSKDHNVRIWFQLDDGLLIITCKTTNNKLALCYGLSNIENKGKWIGTKWLVKILDNEDWIKIKNRELSMNQIFNSNIFIVKEVFVNREKKLIYYPTSLNKLIASNQIKPWKDDDFLFSKEDSLAFKNGTYFISK